MSPSRRTPRTALLLGCMVVGMHMLASTFSRPLFPLLAQEMGLGSALIGLLTSLTYLLPLVVAVPIGAIIDRLGIRRLAAVGSLLLVAANACYTIAGGVGYLAVARVLAGLAQIVVLVALEDYVAGVGHGSQKDRNFGTLFFFSGLGQLVGPLAAGAMGKYWGLRPAFLASTALALVPVGLALAMRGSQGPGPVDGREKPGAAASRRGFADLGALGRLLRLRDVRIGVGASLIMLTAEGARESFYPLYAVSVGYDEVAVGALLSIHALSSILVQPLAGRLSARWGRTRLLSLAMLSGFLGHAAVPLMPGFIPMALAVALAGVGLGANQPPTMALVADAAPEELRGLAVALRLAGNRAALLVSPALAGWVVAVWGLPAYFHASAGMLAGGSALMALLSAAAQQGSDRIAQRPGEVDRMAS